MLDGKEWTDEELCAKFVEAAQENYIASGKKIPPEGLPTTIEGWIAFSKNKEN